MQAERLRRLGLRWGLVALGAMAFVTVCFWNALLEDWLSIREVTDWRVMTARLSQLKPWPWKASYSGTYALLLVAALVVTIGVFFVLGVRDALRPPPDGDEPEPPTAPR